LRVRRDGVQFQDSHQQITGALAVHVINEALTDLLDFYNPLVLSIRSQIGWFRMPTFTFAAWMAGLALVVAVLAGLARRCVEAVLRSGSCRGFSASSCS
jgi:hypothetical protein